MGTHNNTTPSDLRRQAEQMIEDGTMPELEGLLRAVAKARERYQQRILGARHRGRSESRPWR
jgi:formate hydrogenlyase subunit 4